MVVVNGRRMLTKTKTCTNMSMQCKWSRVSPLNLSAQLYNIVALTRLLQPDFIHIV